MEREAFFGRLRVAVHEAELPELPSPAESLPSEAGTAGSLDRFASNLLAVDGACHIADSADHATQLIAGLMAQHGATDFVGWDQEEMALGGLLDALQTAGYGRVDADVRDGRAAQADRHARLAELRVGITGADGGLAESGSIVLAAGAGRSRMASLVAPVHIAILRESDIVPSLSHWVAAHPTAARNTANLVIVTGPSRTADIEQQLNLGVHGPGHLDVVVLPD
jgi:L-lactate dehydrogenase complex protein LldG